MQILKCAFSKNLSLFSVQIILVNNQTRSFQFHDKENAAQTFLPGKMKDDMFVFLYNIKQSSLSRIAEDIKQ